MTLLGLIVVIIAILWLTGQLGTAPASPPPPQIIWVIVVVALVLWFFGSEGNTAWHHGRFWHR